MHSITSQILSGAITVGCLGWYLMLPPETWTGRLNDNAPVAQWYENAATDTANQCEAAKTARRKFIVDHPELTNNAKLYETYAKSLCVDSNDPRLVAHR